MNADTLDVQQVADLLDWPADEWPGNCYAVAQGLVEASVVDGEAVYGHWVGPVAPGSFFADHARYFPFVHHGWVRLPDETIVDPTRWVFEGREPYIWHGANDGNYDEGGNIWRELNLQPPPTYKASARTLDVRFDVETGNFVQSLLGGTLALTWEQAMWMANLPLNHLQTYAYEIYMELIRVGQGALIPMDNRRRVLGKDG